jgi:hypothetical protein
VLDRVQRGQEVERQHDHDERVAEGAEDRQAHSHHAAEESLGDLSAGDVVLGLADDVVLLVPPLDLPVVQQLVEVLRRVLGQGGDLVGHHWRDGEHEQRKGGEETERDEQHGIAPADSSTGDPDDDRVEAEGDEERDDDQHDHRAGSQDQATQPVGEQGTGGQQETGDERVVGPGPSMALGGRLYGCSGIGNRRGLRALGRCDGVRRVPGSGRGGPVRAFWLARWSGPGVPHVSSRRRCRTLPRRHGARRAAP